jgi:hypothetical protein
MVINGSANAFKMYLDPFTIQDLVHISTTNPEISLKAYLRTRPLRNPSSNIITPHAVSVD